MTTTAIETSTPGYGSGMQTKLISCALAAAAAGCGEQVPRSTGVVFPSRQDLRAEVIADAAIADDAAVDVVDADWRADWPGIEFEPQVDPYANVPKPGDPPHEQPKPEPFPPGWSQEGNARVYTSAKNPSRWCIVRGRGEGFCSRSQRECTSTRSQCARFDAYACFKGRSQTSGKHEMWCFSSITTCSAVEVSMRYDLDLDLVEDCIIYRRRAPK